MQLEYTVGLKRRWLPGYRRFRVTGHKLDQAGLHLQFADGTTIYRPSLSVVALKVYPDLKHQVEAMQRAKAEAEERAAFHAFQAAQQRGSPEAVELPYMARQVLARHATEAEQPAPQPPPRPRAAQPAPDTDPDEMMAQARTVARQRMEQMMAQGLQAGAGDE